MLTLNSRIKIGQFQFKGVHDVRIRKGIGSIVELATIKLPSKARVKSQSNPNEMRIVQLIDAFKPGDSVEIELGYNGNYRLEFKGFVKEVVSGIPVAVECEGYSYQLKRNKINKFWAQTTLKEVLTEAIKDTDITLQLESDFPITNLLARSQTGNDIIIDLQKKVTGGILTAFFIEPGVLWVGLQYAAYKAEIKYKTGFNVIKHDMHKSAPGDVTVKILYKGQRKRGSAITNIKGKSEKRIVLHSIPDSNTIKKIAEAAHEKYNNDTFFGKITTFLEPYAAPGDKAIILPKENIDFDGSYLITSTDVSYGRNGARRVCELGVLIGTTAENVAVNITETNTTDIA